MLLNLEVTVKWKCSIEHKFNAVAYGKLFKNPKDSIVTIGEDGIVRVFEPPVSNGSQQLFSLKLARSLETKCGSASHILLRDVTRLSPCDMIVSDTRGSVVLFCDGQILVRKCSLSGKSSRVRALEVQETAMGHVYVLVGYDDGELSCFNTFSQQWKIRLQDIFQQAPQASVSVTCILATSVVTSSSMGTAGDYVLVADTRGYLHILQQGVILNSLQIGSIVTSMVAGCFLQIDESLNNKELTQIALGCSDGSIWILVDFSIDKTSSYAEIGHPVTHLHKIPSNRNYAQATGANTINEQVDIIVCGGHFSSLKLLQYGKIIHSHPLPSWLISMCGLKDSLDLEARSKTCSEDNLVLIGCQDSSLQLLSIM